MLVELAVSDLGVIADLSLVLSPGMTALTGETGAGKTLVVTAIELLVGGRADAAIVRAGADEARVEGRFVDGHGDELVLARVIPADGRSRAYVNGRLAPAASLAELGAGLVDLHGQHAHQSLLSAPTQRAALDAFGAVDLQPLRAARGRLTEIDAALATLGGDERARAREIDLLRFQVGELDGAGITGPDEDEELAAQEAVVADATAHREAAERARLALSEEGRAADAIGEAIAAVAGRAPFTEIETRLRAAAADIADLAVEIRSAAEQITEDPETLARLRERRQLLHDLRRKYGATLAEVLDFADEARARLAELESRDARAAALDAERVAACEQERAAAGAVAAARRAAAPALAAAVQERLATLAMARAQIAIAVDGADPGDDVAFLLAANPGEPPAPLSKVASGGELARTMLALRLVLGSADVPTLIFDEVDAGVGGEAALSVGRALATLGRDTQVLVVTHLPQVAAFADHQVAVTKAEEGGRTVARASRLDDAARVVELSRMLSGQPASAAAHDHAEELLAVAARDRQRTR
ncbi:MAG TPA: DNA repair protein RecN [Acidimicrobiales bacterium]|nr:DNA repair protein RecN [Acidimicrobiales bacterium]